MKTFYLVKKLEKFDIQTAAEYCINGLVPDAPVTVEVYDCILTAFRTARMLSGIHRKVCAEYGTEPSTKWSVNSVEVEDHVSIDEVRYS